MAVTGGKGVCLGGGVSAQGVIWLGGSAHEGFLPGGGGVSAQGGLSGWGCLAREVCLVGVSAQGISAWGMSARGVSAHKGCLPGGVSA